VSAPVILYDGVCTFCNASVRFVLDHERTPPVLRFAPLQSTFGRAQLARHGIAVDDLSSMRVLVDDRLLDASTAALFIAGYLRAPWRWLRLLRVVPRPLRDAAYRFIGRHRYRWWGRTDTCQPIPAASRARFFD
jgi:predicted DCC family thiol-disulfide oxidoreductase YuxK